MRLFKNICGNNVLHALETRYLIRARLHDYMYLLASHIDISGVQRDHVGITLLNLAHTIAHTATITIDLVYEKRPVFC